jgi:hypothetical protein
MKGTSQLVLVWRRYGAEKDFKRPGGEARGRPTAHTKGTPFPCGQTQHSLPSITQNERVLSVYALSNPFPQRPKPQDESGTRLERTLALPPRPPPALFSFGRVSDKRPGTFVLWTMEVLPMLALLKEAGC